MLRALLAVVLAVVGSTQISHVAAHHESVEWRCESGTDTRVEAKFRPAEVTLDGHILDWENTQALYFVMSPALNPYVEYAYKPGKMIVKALHDGRDIFFMLQVNGDYVYSKGDNKKCPSVSLMFQIGDDATYHNMGGCKEGPDSCTNKTCHGHEVDIMHFSIGNAIPGRLYGGNRFDNGDGNGGDRFGHLVDAYSWNPHCLNLDGIGPLGNDSSAQNDWKGVWWHSSLDAHSAFVEEDSPYGSDGQKGTYYFEFSRPLRTMDRLQQDAQFIIGRTSNMSVAFWYPEDGKPWHGSGHYSINCDWVPLDLKYGGYVETKPEPCSPWNAVSAFSVLFSVASLCMAVYVGRWLSGTKGVPFTPVANL